MITVTLWWMLIPSIPHKQVIRVVSIDSENQITHQIRTTYAKIQTEPSTSLHGRQCWQNRNSNPLKELRNFINTLIAFTKGVPTKQKTRLKWQHRFLTNSLATTWYAVYSIHRKFAVQQITYYHITQNIPWYNMEVPTFSDPTINITRLDCLCKRNLRNKSTLTIYRTINNQI